MTPEDLVASVRRGLAKPKRAATQTELVLAQMVLDYANLTSSGFVRADPPVVPDIKMPPEPVQ